MSQLLLKGMIPRWVLLPPPLLISVRVNVNGAQTPCCQLPPPDRGFGPTEKELQHSASRVGGEIKGVLSPAYITALRASPAF